MTPLLTPPSMRHCRTTCWRPVRRAVRTLGKEAATYRFTQEEKRALSSIVYAYKERGIKTSENEITRIALNYLIDEYRRNNTSSILARVLARLNQ